MTDRKEIAQQIYDRLTEHGGDLNAAFPNPFRFHKHQRGRRQAFYDWELAHLLTEPDPTKPWGWAANGSYFVIPNEKTFTDYVEGRLNITTRRSATGQALPPEYSPATAAAGTVEEGRHGA